MAQLDPNIILAQQPVNLPAVGNALSQLQESRTRNRLLGDREQALKQSEQQQGEVNRLSLGAAQGNPQAMNSLTALDPAKAKQITDLHQAQLSRQAQDEGRYAAYVLQSPDPQAAYQKARTAFMTKYPHVQLPEQYDPQLMHMAVANAQKVSSLMVQNQHAADQAQQNNQFSSTLAEKQAALAEQKRHHMVGEQQTNQVFGLNEKKLDAKNQPDVNTNQINHEIDSTLNLIQQHPTVVGGVGKIKEAVSGLMGQAGAMVGLPSAGGDDPVAKYHSKLNLLRAQATQIIKSFKGRLTAKNMQFLNGIISGDSWTTSPEQAATTLREFKSIVNGIGAGKPNSTASVPAQLQSYNPAQHQGQKTQIGGQTYISNGSEWVPTKDQTGAVPTASEQAAPTASQTYSWSQNGQQVSMSKAELSAIAKKHGISLNELVKQLGVKGG